MKWWRLLVFVCVAAIAFSLLLPLGAVWAAQNYVWPSSEVAAKASPQRETGSAPGLGVRKLPLLSEETEQAISLDGELLGQQEIAARGRLVADQIGLDWDQLFLLADQGTASNYDHLTGRVSYSELDDLIQSGRGVKTLEGKPEVVVDLSSLLVLSGAQFSGGLAQGLLGAGEAPASHCGRALNLAFIAHLDMFPPTDEAAQHLRSTVSDACGDDPTALWFLASLGRSDIPQESACVYSFPAEDLPADGLLWAKRLQEHHPEIAAGWAAEANILMAQAAEENKFGLRPFAARQRWIGALDLLTQAQALSASAELTMARAAAMTGSGQVGEAAEIVDAIDPEQRRQPGMARLAAWIYGQNRDFSAARDALLNVPTVAAGPAMRRELSAVSGHAAVGGQPALVAQPASAVGYQQASEVRLQGGGLGYGGCGASAAVDGGLVPVSRHSSVARGSMVEPQIAELHYLNNDLAGLAQECEENSSGESVAICAVASAPGSSLSFYFEQDLLRAAGKLDEAVRLASERLSSDPNDAVALSQLGEMELQRGQPRAAVTAFEAALKNPARLDAFPAALDASSGWVRLRLGYAISQLGHSREATTEINRARPMGAVMIYDAGPYPSDADDRISFSYYQTLLLAGLHADQGRVASFSEWVQGVRLAEEFREDAYWAGVKPPAGGVAEQNAALMATRQGNFSEAAYFARAAVAHDGANPLYAETLVEIERGVIVSKAADISGVDEATEAPSGAAGQPSLNPHDSEALIASYEQVLELDSTLFSSWNNLGVLLSKSGRHAEAEEAFRKAIQVKPDYALGWFNLGSELTLYGKSWDIIVGQGALGLAAKSDPALKEMLPGLVFDEEIYESGLDLSQVLPADWTLAPNVRKSTTPLTVLMVLVSFGLILNAIAKDSVLGWVAERLSALTATLTGPWRSLLWLPAWLGVLISSLLLSFAAGASTWAEVALGVPFALALAALPWVLRKAVPVQQSAVNPQNNKLKTT